MVSEEEHGRHASNVLILSFCSSNSIKQFTSIPTPILLFHKSLLEREEERDERRRGAKKSSTGALLADHRHPTIAAAVHLVPKAFSTVTATVLLLLLSAAAVAVADLPGGFRGALRWDFFRSDAVWISDFDRGNNFDAAGYNLDFLLLFFRNCFLFLQN